jgi:hydroxypyruvate reductase
MAATPWPSIDPGAYGRALRGLIDQGTPIAELNCVRRHCERLKGGGMAHECGAGAIEVLVLSDVIGDDLATVASGPFAPDATTNVDAAEILMKRLGGEGATVAQVLQRPEHPETLKVPDPRVSHTILASNEMVIQAVAAAIRETVDVTLVRTGLTGDVADVVDRLDGDASFVRMGSEPRAMVFGGEYTVDASTCRGIGGPSQELALHLAEIMMNETHPWSRHAHWGVWTLSTDGRDGPSEGSGALLSDAMMPNAAESRASIARALHHHDSSAYLRGVGGLIPRRSTGTNLNHVGILAAW